MNNCSSEELLTYNNKVFQELYKIDTLINLTKNFCEEKEFKAQYYGIDAKQTEMLSEERNNYINMLTLVSDSISSLMKLNINMEEKLSVYYKNIPTIAADK